LPSLDDIRAGHRHVTGLLVPAILALVAAGLGAGGWVLGSQVAVAAALHWLLTVFMLLGARHGLRAVAPASTPKKRRRQVALLAIRRLLPAAAVAAGLYFLPAFESADKAAGSLGLAGALLAVAFGASVLARYYGATAAEQLPDALGLATLARVGTWLAFLAAVSLALRAAGRPLGEREVVLILAAVPAALAAEMLLLGLWGVIRRHGANADFGADLQISRFLGSSFNPFQSLFIAVERTFGVDVRSSWALTFLRRTSAPVVCGLAVVAWMLSAVVMVDASQRAVRERFGRVQPDQVLEPGLHVGLPWPLDRVQVVDVHRVREVPIGYAEPKVGANALWTKLHAAEEFNLLLGDGRDLVTVNAELQYRVGDIHAWLYGTQNPEVALETLAYQVLMNATVDQSLAQVLSADIGNFSARMTASIQTLADRHNLGVEVVSFNLRGLHPPVAVATDYQAVVEAQIEKRTVVMRAQAYRYKALPKAEADGFVATREAQAERADRLSSASGEAIAFKVLGVQFSVSPELYRFRRRLETIERVLAETPFYVIDSRIERDGGALWIIE